jgi:hypothetical protein
MSEDLDHLDHLDRRQNDGGKRLGPFLTIRGRRLDMPEARCDNV